eukprot:Gb_10880 [translate_table: standard]
MVQSFPAAATTTTTVYALALCRRSLSNQSCAKCLQAAQNLTLQCLPRRDGKGLEAGCYLRYAPFPFFSINQAQSPSGQGSKRKSKTVGILIGSIGGTGIARHTKQGKNLPFLRLTTKTSELQPRNSTPRTGFKNKLGEGDSAKSTRERSAMVASWL